MARAALDDIETWLNGYLSSAQYCAVPATPTGFTDTP
jgi:hypothetical protein